MFLNKFLIISSIRRGNLLSAIYRFLSVSQEKKYSISIYSIYSSISINNESNQKQVHEKGKSFRFKKRSFGWHICLKIIFEC